MIKILVIVLNDYLLTTKMHLECSKQIYYSDIYEVQPIFTVDVQQLFNFL